MLIDTQRYISPAFLALERERLWPHVWLLAAHASEVPAPGSYATFNFGMESLLLLRDRDRVRCFHNVCIHRGTVLCEEPRGARSEIRCPYHGWTYDLAGQLLGGPGTDELRRENAGLAPVACEERAGFIWIRLGSEGQSLDEFLGPMLPMLEALDLGALRLVTDRSCELPCNWKLNADIHNEALHLTTVHPQLSELIDTGDISWEAVGRHAHFTIPLGIPSTGPFAGKVGPQLRALLKELGSPAATLADAALTREAVREALRTAIGKRASAIGVGPGPLDAADKNQYYLFPNVQLNITGLDLEMYRHRPHPTDPLRCEFDVVRYARMSPEAPARKVVRSLRPPGAEPGETADAQDSALAGRVQRGMLSSGLPVIQTGPHEEAIAHMHQGISQLLGTPEAA